MSTRKKLQRTKKTVTRRVVKKPPMSEKQMVDQLCAALEATVEDVLQERNNSMEGKLTAALAGVSLAAHYFMFAVALAKQESPRGPIASAKECADMSARFLDRLNRAAEAGFMAEAALFKLPAAFHAPGKPGTA